VSHLLLRGFLVFLAGAIAAVMAVQLIGNPGALSIFWGYS